MPKKMFEDRLRPRYSGSLHGRAERRLASGKYHNSSTGWDSPHSPVSPRQQRARAIVRKYRRNVRYSQLHKLKSLVPAVAHMEEASEIDVLNETVRYIEDLERRLLERVRAAGTVLPTPTDRPRPAAPTSTDTSSSKLPQATATVHPAVSSSTNTTATNACNNNPITAAGKPSSSTPTTTSGLQIHDLRNMLHQSLQPVLEKKLKMARMEDDRNISRLIAEDAANAQQ